MNDQLFEAVAYITFIEFYIYIYIFFIFFSVNDTKGKKKVLGSNKKLKFNPTELILYSKDLRIIRFCFDQAGPESAKKVGERNVSSLKRLLKCVAWLAY